MHGLRLPAHLRHCKISVCLLNKRSRSSLDLHLRYFPFHIQLGAVGLWTDGGGQGPDLQPTCSGYPLISFTIVVDSVALIQRLLSVRVQKCASSLVWWLLFPGFVFFGCCWEVCCEMLCVTERRKEARQDVCGGKRICVCVLGEGSGNAFSKAWCL